MLPHVLLAQAREGLVGPRDTSLLSADISIGLLLSSTLDLMKQIQPSRQAGRQVTPKEVRHRGHGAPNLAYYALHGASVLSQHTHPCAVPQRNTKATTTPLALSYEKKILSQITE